MIRDERLVTAGQHPLAVVFVLAVLALGLARTAVAQAQGTDGAAMLPEDQRFEAVQSPEQFFGFPIGSRHLRHDQIVAYFRHLADSSPRVTLIPYGHSHGGRPLMVAAITSPDHTERLDELKKARRRLTSGKLDAAPDDAIVVMYMGYNVHGDEASAANAAPMVAYHLASSQSDQVVGWLEKTVYLLDPVMNPDGLDRFTNWVNDNRGRHANDSAVDREHHQPWPGGRTNYYWFDLNRDWLPLVHPESRGRLRLFHQWKPNVNLDYHEMSGNSSYFFQPGVPARNNPLSPEENLRLTRAFAVEHAADMDAANELFFTEERFDDFYVGKGSTYPDLHGSVGILFEQGSTRALRLKNERTKRHFKDTVANQVRTSLSSLRAAAKYHDELLAYQTNFYAAALKAGRDSQHQAFILLGTPQRIQAAGDLLRLHAIESFRPQGPITLEGETHAPSRVLIIPAAQPEYTFIRSLMETPQDFKENLFYDVSTWHLPSALGLSLRHFDSDLPEAWLANKLTTATAESSERFDRQDQVTGYVVEPTDLSAATLVARLLQMGADVRVTPEPIVVKSADAEQSDAVQTGAKQEWPAGSYLVLRQPNAARWNRVLDVLQRSADRGGVVTMPLRSSRTIAGPDLGSDSLMHLAPAKPLLVVGPGTTAGSAGSLWHFLDIRLQQPATLVDTTRISSVELSDYSCVILPAGSYGDWGSGQVDSLARYVRGGGTVIATSSAISWLSRKELIKLAATEEEDESKDGDGKPGASRAQQGTGPDSPAKPLSFGDARDRSALESIAGAFLMTKIDPTHPLGYGFPDANVPVFRDHSVRFTPPKNPYQTAAHYTEVIAGYVSSRNRDRLRDSAAVWVEPAGKGRFILLADDPVFRGYVRSSERFLTNAILLGPGLRIPAAPSNR